MLLLPLLRPPLLFPIACSSAPEDRQIRPVETGGYGLKRTATKTGMVLAGARRVEQYS